MNLMWLMRMRRWVAHPPSASRVRLVVGVVAICLALLAVEHFLGWPEALTPNRMRR